MRFSRSNPILVAFFFGGIILPTAILSVLSFRNIQNETFLAKKNFEESLKSFKKEVENVVQKEQRKILQETKAASQFLYEQPQNLLEFGNASSFKNVNGLSAIFLFNKETIVYPNIASHFYYESSKWPQTNYSSIEQQLFFEEINKTNEEKVKLARSIRLMQSPFQTKTEQVQNLLGLLRNFYQNKKYDEALHIISLLQQRPNLQSYLHYQLRESLQLLHFEILVELKRHEEAQNLCLLELNRFLQQPHINDISATRYFFETTFNQILSFEQLTQETREAFWNLRENFNRQLTHTEILYEHLPFFKKILSDHLSPKEGILYRFDGNDFFFRMSYPWLSGDQIVIGKINIEAYEARIRSQIQTVAREWKNIPYTITNVNNSILVGSIPENGMILEQQILGQDLSWTLTLYQKDQKEFRKETRHKMFLLYGLVSFSLITVLFGSFFMFRFLIQERKLLFMKSNFLSSVSHELKTPLTSIKMFAEMMAKGRVQKPEKIQEYSLLIGKESSRLENLIGAILSYTRMEHTSTAFKWERFDFGVCAETVYNALVDIALQKPLETSSRIEKNLFVMGDYTSLYSLIQNLIENAIKYTNSPGSIFVQAYEENEKIVFSVTDTGIGIPSSEQKNIFNDFYRVGDEMTRSTKGSGLGLAIVKRVAETHKAFISLQSRLGKGSTFTVRFKKAE